LTAKLSPIQGTNHFQSKKQQNENQWSEPVSNWQASVLLQARFDRVHESWTFPKYKPDAPASAFSDRFGGAMHSLARCEVALILDLISRSAGRSERSIRAQASRAA